MSREEVETSVSFEKRRQLGMRAVYALNQSKAPKSGSTLPEPPPAKGPNP